MGFDSGGDRECFDLADFTIQEMTTCGRVLRGMGAGAGSMEEVAAGVVRYLFDHLVDRRTGARVCALARFFKTHDYGGLDPKLQSFARRLLGDAPPSQGMKCLVLLGTAGEEPQWQSREGSRGHQAIPLPSEEAVAAIPMIRNLIKQLGLEVSAVIHPDRELIRDLEQKSYNVFNVPNALGSPHIPAQQEFVIPYGIRSVLGFGGLLPSGNTFVVILFLKVSVTDRTADCFKALALNVKMSVLPFGSRVFAVQSSRGNP